MLMSVPFTEGYIVHYNEAHGEPVVLIFHKSHCEVSQYSSSDIFKCDYIISHNAPYVFSWIILTTFIINCNI